MDLYFELMGVAGWGGDESRRRRAKQMVAEHDRETLVYKSGTLKRVVWYFEEDGALLLRGWCATLKMVVWYFEEGDMVL